jgi:hypothetical protein
MLLFQIWYAHDKYIFIISIQGLYTNIVRSEIRCAIRLRCVAIYSRRIFGPLFFEETANSKRYCSMLNDFSGLLEEDEITYS